MSLTPTEMMEFFRLAYVGFSLHGGGGSFERDLCDSYQNHLRALLTELGLR